VVMMARVELRTLNSVSERMSKMMREKLLNMCDKRVCNQPQARLRW
jgi:hypothetical protein